MVRGEAGKRTVIALEGLAWAGTLRMMGTPWWAVLPLAFLQTVFPQESADKVALLSEVVKAGHRHARGHDDGSG